MQSKQLLRKKIKNIVGSLDPARLRNQAENAARALRCHSYYQQSKSIAFYMHMDQGELQTLDMIFNAFRDGKRVFLPHIVKYETDEEHPWFPSQKTHLRMLELPDFDAVSALEPRGKYKLKEPTSGLDCLSAEGPGLDLLVVPGVGFTKACGRLGHGAGFYDSFISEHERAKSSTPKLIGVGLEEQLVEPSSELPLASHDRVLDSVILGGKVYDKTNII